MTTIHGTVNGVKRGQLVGPKQRGALSGLDAVEPQQHMYFGFSYTPFYRPLSVLRRSRVHVQTRPSPMAFGLVSNLALKGGGPVLVLFCTV
jgi:hypothetical protein